MEYAVIFCLLTSVVLGTWVLCRSFSTSRHARPYDESAPITEWPHSSGARCPDVDAPGSDPWELQRQLMMASGQQLPLLPELNRTSMLYLALMMEELAETAAGVEKALQIRHSGHMNGDDDKTLREMRLLVRVAATSIANNAEHLRKMLSAVDDFRVQMRAGHEHEVLDGTTDLAVVNCGFALACGMPGSRAYAEVVGSNLSKRNPETGVIDVDAGGKWIKGSDYQAPNLAAVLDEHARFAVAAALPLPPEPIRPRVELQPSV